MLAQPAPPQPVTAMFCAADAVAVRAAASDDAPLFDQLARGTRVLVLASDGDWLRVKLPDPGGEGWVRRDQVSDDRPAGPRLTDGQVRRILIRESIAAYDGNCPCPYFTDSIGRSCGRRSAWSREGGEEPYCYPRDVSDDAVREWRAANGADAPDTDREPPRRAPRRRGVSGRRPRGATDD